MTATDLILVFVLLSNLTLLGASSLAGCIQLTAAQGVALSVLPLLVAEHGIGPRLVALAAVVLLLKGFLFPRLLRRTQHMADVRHELEPFVGYATSILAGMAIVLLSFWISSRLALPRAAPSLLALPAALATILSGLLLIVGRRKALTQVIGYLVLENGIYIFGVSLAQEQPLLIEMGILLDVFVAVFVMGIAIFHISREFDHMDVDQLTSLKD